MMSWGDKYLAPSGAPVTLTHNACGNQTRPVLTCDCCGEAIHARNVTPQQAAPEPTSTE